MLGTTGAECLLPPEMSKLILSRNIYFSKFFIGDLRAKVQFTDINEKIPSGSRKPVFHEVEYSAAFQPRKILQTNHIAHFAYHAIKTIAARYG